MAAMLTHSFLPDVGLTYWHTQRRRALLERLQARGELGQEALHADAREARELDARVVGVQLRDGQMSQHGGALVGQEVHTSMVR